MKKTLHSASEIDVEKISEAQTLLRSPLALLRDAGATTTAGHLPKVIHSSQGSLRKAKRAAGETAFSA